jgi:hypothetical protein
MKEWWSGADGGAAATAWLDESNAE